MKEKNNKILFYSIAAFLIPFAVYIMTLAPTINFIDSDELATVSSLLGVAHPTGYPLFTILGKVFTLIPVGDEVYRLNLMSAFISAISVMVFFRLMVFVISDFRINRSDKTIGEKLTSAEICNISLAAALLMAFSLTFWDNATVIEVYSVHALFLILLTFIFLKAINFNIEQDISYLRNEKYFILFALLLGLSFSNHMSTAFLSVGFLYLFIITFGFSRATFNKLILLLIPFITGLTLYFYLFIRTDGSLLSWGKVDSLGNFIDHITGKQYETRMFTSVQDIFTQMGRYFSYYVKEYSYLHLILILPGIIGLYKKNKSFFYFTLILFMSGLLLASAYMIYDLYSYYLLSTVITAVWSGFGLMFIINKLGEKVKWASYASLLIFIVPLSVNFNSADKSNDYMLKDYNFNLFNSAPENSIIITNYAPVFYFQNVKKVRKDLVFVNRDYLYNKWYLNSFKNTYPEIYTESKTEFDNYEIQLDKLISNKEKYLAPKTQSDNQGIYDFQKAMRDLLNSIIEKNITRTNVFTTLEIDEVNDEKFATDYKKIPTGVLFKLRKPDMPDDYVNIELSYTVNFDKDFSKEYIMNTYYKANLYQAKYLTDKSDIENAKKFLLKASELKPGSQDVLRLQQKLNQLK
jgi:hypothetical protein